eukprot:923839-Amorphochlora_amoeboformis.AAC.1
MKAMVYQTATAPLRTLIGLPNLPRVSRQDASRQNTSRQDTCRQDTSRQDTSREDTSRQDTAKGYMIWNTLRSAMSQCDIEYLSIRSMITVYLSIPMPL